MKLFFDPTGPLLRYKHGTLYIDDLNPEITIQWRMSRFEMFKVGLRCMVAALRRERAA
jgi:hypothetical protein